MKEQTLGSRVACAHPVGNPWQLQALEPRLLLNADTLATAVTCGLLNGSLSYSDTVNASDRNDYYRFDVASTRSATVTLTGLAGNADINLLDSAGATLAYSRQTGKANESIVRSLTAGTYYVQVYAAGDNTRYTLGLSSAYVAVADGAGNTQAAAKAVSALSATPAVFSDYVGNGDPNDYYSFTLAVRSDFTANLTGLVSDADMGLLNSKGQTVVASQHSGMTAESIAQTLDAGVYSIRVYPYSGSTNYSLSLAAVANMPPPDNAGNTPATARDIGALGTTVSFSDYVGTLDANDYYRFTVAASSNVTIAMNGLTADADMSLLNSAGAVIVTSNKSGTTAESIAQTVAAGAYYVRVYPYSGSTNYTLSLAAVANVPPPDNAGNALATARDIGALGTAVSFSDYVGTLDANDYYRFTVALPSNVTLAMNGLTSDADMSLLNSAGTVIVTSSKSGTTAESIASTLDAGTYYIRVYPYSGSTNYTLTASAARADAVAPTAALNASSVAYTSATATFTVSYADNYALNVATLDGNDIVVSGPGGFTAAAAFVSVNVNSNGTARTATYSFSAPGGTWDTADTGTYTISLQAGQVSDTSGNFAAAASLGTFAYPAPPAPPSDWFSTNLHDAGLIAAARTAYADSTFTRTEMITVLGASGSDDGIVDATELADMRTLVAASTLAQCRPLKP